MPEDDLSATLGKISAGKDKKERGDKAFKCESLQEALKMYHEALMFLLGLHKDALASLGMPEASSGQDAEQKSKEKTEVDELVEKIYANMSACHIKNQNWQRALETAEKALAKNENNQKALFRKSKALGQLGYTDKALNILKILIKEHPSDLAFSTEYNRLVALNKEREREANKKLKGFLLKKPRTTESDSTSAYIEEVSEQVKVSEQVNDTCKADEASE